MSSTEERVCVGCGLTEEKARLERCGICARHFCPDCGYRQAGRRFCSGECARAYLWGEGDDDDEKSVDD